MSTKWEDYNSLVEDIAPFAKPSSDGWSRANCPVCEFEGHSADTRESLGINESGVWHCFKCLSKGFIGDEDEQDVVPIWENKTEEVLEEEPRITLPEEYRPIWREPGLSSIGLMAARNYMLGRGFTRDQWELAEVGACSSGYYAERVIFPVYGEDRSTLLGFAARLNREHEEGERKTLFPKGMKTGSIFYQQHLLNDESQRPLLVVEGVMDALPYWGDAIALFGKPGVVQRNKLLQARRPLAIVLDSDASEDAWRLVRFLRTHSKEAGFVGLPKGKDPDEVDPQELMKKATQCTKE